MRPADPCIHPVVDYRFLDDITTSSAPNWAVRANPQFKVPYNHLAAFSTNRLEPLRRAGFTTRLLLLRLYSAIEHGRAERVDAVMETDDSGELCFHITEHGGHGMSPKECELAIRFGLHAAKADAESLRNYSHNGIGTKACLNIFSRLAIFSIRAIGKAGGRTYCVLVLDVADSSGSGTCLPATRLVWKSNSHGDVDWGGPDGPQASIISGLCARVSYSFNSFVLRVALTTMPWTPPYYH